LSCLIIGVLNGMLLIRMINGAICELSC